mmetsp:Transcript_109214/g.282329  ORF Transcript_109214/g.282329 Transcript_109214/m.282329 type:complete len:211 (+) Transcript_109214:267-899(+)
MCLLELCIFCQVKGRIPVVRNDVLRAFAVRPRVEIVERNAEGVHCQGPILHVPDAEAHFDLIAGVDGDGTEVPEHAVFVRGPGLVGGQGIDLHLDVPQKLSIVTLGALIHDALLAGIRALAAEVRVQDLQDVEVHAAHLNHLVAPWKLARARRRAREDDLPAAGVSSDGRPAREGAAQGDPREDQAGEENQRRRPADCLPTARRQQRLLA